EARRPPALGAGAVQKHDGGERVAGARQEEGPCQRHLAARKGDVALVEYRNRRGDADVGEPPIARALVKDAGQGIAVQPAREDRGRSVPPEHQRHVAAPLEPHLVERDAAQAQAVRAERRSVATSVRVVLYGHGNGHGITRTRPVSLPVAAQSLLTCSGSWSYAKNHDGNQ